MKISTKIVQVHGMITIMGGAVGGDRSQHLLTSGRARRLPARRVWVCEAVSVAIQTKEGHSNV